MIEDLFPKTVGNILDYDAIKLAAKQYVEDVFVNIVQEFADNMTLYTMDAAHLADVAGHVAGDSSLSLEQLLDYINAENVYHECDFVSELLAAFPEGVEYKEFDVTGWGFPGSDFFPFNNENRSFHTDGTPTDGQDTDWLNNTLDNSPERNLLMSRYKGQFDENDNPHWHRKEGRRSSWGNPATWMTSGGFGKPATIHINVDEERTVIEGNGLTAVENWLGTVSNKLPINLYIEIESHFVTNAEPASSSLEGYHMAFPYEEEEGFCTNDPNMAVTLNNATPPTPPPPPPPPEPAYSFIVFDTTTDTIVHSVVDEGLVYGDVGYVLIEDEGLVYGDVGYVLMDEAGSLITVYETGVKTESFYFTTNGRNETANTNISHSDIPVYNEDGTAPAADTPYDGSPVLAFVDVDGNTKQADGESLYLDDGELRLDAPDTDEGEQWSALVEYIEPAPPLPEVHSMTGRLGSSSSVKGSSTVNFTILTDGSLWFFKLEGGSYSKAVVNEGTVLAVAKINNTSNEPQYYGFVARRVASDGTVRLMNNNYATYNSATSVDIYYCEDPSVGVATVTNGNGDKFWAFKYIVDGVAYYYVLDLSSGSLPSQSWVSDLSSLGYTLFNATLYYLSSPKEPIVIGSNGYSNLLLDNGNYLSYNFSRKYRIINAYTSETDSIGIGCESFWVSSSMSLATLYNSDVAHAFYSVEIVIT